MTTNSTPAFVLTQEQIRFFHVFGYLKLPGLFKNEIIDIQHRFDDQFIRRHDDIISLNNHAHYFKTRQLLLNFIDSDPWFSSLLADERIQGIASALAGDDFNFLSSDGNIFSENTIWHADTYQLFRGHVFLKIAFYLDPMPASTSAFRVIPGSHHEGAPYSKQLHEVMPQHQEKLGLEADEIPCQIIASEPGDIIVFNYRLHHATCHATQTRRMFHYGISPRFEEKQFDYLAKMWRETVQKKGFIYGDALCQQQDPRIQRHLQQLLAVTETLRTEIRDC